VGPGLMNIMFFPGTVNDLAAGTIFKSSVTLQWSTPGYDGLAGTLQARTTYFIRVASYTVPNTFGPPFANISFSTNATTPGLAVSTPAYSLLSNTTYWTNLWTIDAGGNMSLIPQLSTFTTLTSTPAMLTTRFLNVYATSVTVAWAALRAGPPSSATCEGYSLEASSTNFSALSPGGQVYSSVTYRVSQSTLTVYSPALDSAATYYFRVGALNWSGQPNYAFIGSTVTKLQVFAPKLLADSYAAVSSFSVTAQWDPFDGNPAATIYTLQASTASDLTGQLYSSTTYNSSFQLYTLGLDTTY
jgi:hypothetical protein